MFGGSAWTLLAYGRAHKKNYVIEKATFCMLLGCTKYVN